MSAESRVRETILTLGRLLEVHVDIRSIEEIEGGYLVRVDSPQSNQLIGPGGETLRALQYLVSAIIRPELGVGERVTVDIGDYLVRQQERLAREAEEVAGRVIKSGEPEELRPMNSGERRLVHLALQEHPQVATDSTGEGRDRRVVVKPRDASSD